MQREKDSRYGYIKPGYDNPAHLLSIHCFSKKKYVTDDNIALNDNSFIAVKSLYHFKAFWRSKLFEFSLFRLN